MEDIKVSELPDYNYELLGIEFHRMQLLKLFEKFCESMKNTAFSTKVRNFYRNTTNPFNTTKALFSNEYHAELDVDDTKQITEWIIAHLKKKSFRIPLSEELKHELYIAQSGKCNICGCDLGNDYSRIHIDHIIPWVLVGDELPDNYQDLCAPCNLQKNKQVDYYYKKLVHLV